MKMKIGIVGAGIVGLYLAWKLSEKGQSVTVFEKKAKIGKESCSGLFSERILKFIPESRKLIQNQIESTLIHFPNRTLKVKFSKKFFVMSHFELDNLVAKLAERAGAKIILNYNVSRTFLDVLYKKFDKIIGCDGPNSIVRESLSLPKPHFRLAIQGFIAKSDDSNFVETWPTPQENKFPTGQAPQENKFPTGQAKSGFIWKIPRGRETEYGIIENPQNCRRIFKEFLKRKNLQLEGTTSGIIPQGFSMPSNPLITLCGDAVGLTKSWSGGGVIWGLMAAEILLKNFPDFLKYQREMRKFFLPKITFLKIITKLVYFLGFKMPWLLPRNSKVESDFLI